MDRDIQSDKNNSVVSVPSQKSDVSGALTPISFYKKDKNFVFAQQKTEKLVAAMYMLTNFFPSEEPLKWSVRNLGGKLLSLTIQLAKGGAIGARDGDVEAAIRSTVLEMTSLLEVASFTGLISEMNLSILKKEFHALLSHINTMVLEHTTHDGTFLESELLKSSVNNNLLPHNLSQRYSDGDLPVTPHEFIKDKIVETSRKTKQLKEFSPITVKKNKRQSTIIHLLKRKKEIMVKDVAEIIHDCSEKTLQRELLSLVSTGVLTKRGERRWTHYMLAPGME